MRILITGATGQLGLALASRLQDLGTLDRNRQGGPRSFAAEFHSIERLDQLAPELIINAAAYTAVDKAEEERELVRIVNAEAPGMMAIWAASRNVPLIHFSTDYVFEARRRNVHGARTIRRRRSRPMAQASSPAKRQCAPPAAIV